MCLFKGPTIKQEKVAPAPPTPEAPPEAPAIGDPDLRRNKRNGRNSLRIDLAGAGNTSLGPSGLTI